MIRWFFLLLLAPQLSSAQDVAALLSRGAQLEAAFKEEQAFSVYQQILQIQPHHLFALCRCSDLSCRIGNRLTDRDKKIAYFKTGYQYAQTAYRLDSTFSEANIAMAFSLARMALIQSGGERVESAKEIRRFAEQAIRDDPGNYKAYHILGRWEYEVSNLNFVERTLARWFFGALPEASLEESVRNYEKSRALKPDFLLNYYELARAYKREGRNDEAMMLLRQMETLPDGMYDDRIVREQGEKLLEQLR